jgi:hypothetical protein
MVRRSQMSEQLGSYVAGTQTPEPHVQAEGIAYLHVGESVYEIAGANWADIDDEVVVLRNREKGRPLALAKLSDNVFVTFSPAVPGGLAGGADGEAHPELPESIPD